MLEHYNNSKPNLHWCGGEENLELKKARGKLLGERAMVPWWKRSAGWVGSPRLANIALTMQVDIWYQEKRLLQISNLKCAAL